ncbi:peptidase inhibitor family I36 protein [Streptomyces clavifer]|uniref:peptidase inhibitor family I36 protein n=1 Tax=Streptomyces clavifer TaxID=68188 RepID=UPI003325A4F6
MGWMVRATTVAAALTLATGSALTGATPAAAVGGCASGYLCVYDANNFEGDKIVSSSTNSCFNPHLVKPTWWRTMSYVNNNSVDAVLWAVTTPGGLLHAVRTLPRGGFSSAIPPHDESLICLGTEP